MSELRHYYSGFFIPSQTRSRVLSGFLRLSFMLILAGDYALAQTNTNLVTEFSSDAVLTSAQIQDVLKLARECGVTNAREIRTFHYLPAGGIGMTVKDEEHITPLTVDYCTANVNNTAWRGETANANAKRVGQFWVVPPFLETNHFALFTHDNKLLRVGLDPEIPLSIVTAIFLGLENRDVIFDPSAGDLSLKQTFETGIHVSEWMSLTYRQETDSYELMFRGGGFLSVKLTKGKVVVMSVGHWVI